MKKSNATKLATGYDIATLTEALLLRLANDGMAVTGPAGNVLRDMQKVGMAADGLCSVNLVRIVARDSLRNLAEWPDSTAQRSETAAHLREVQVTCKSGSEEHTRIGSQIRTIESGVKIPAESLRDWARGIEVS